MTQPRLIAAWQALSIWIVITVAAVLFGWPVPLSSALAAALGIVMGALFYLTPTLARHLERSGIFGRPRVSTLVLTVVYCVFIWAFVVPMATIEARAGEFSIVAAVASIALVAPAAAFVMASADHVVAGLVPQGGTARRAAVRWATVTSAYTAGLGPVLIHLFGIAEYLLLWVPVAAVVGILGGIYFSWLDSRQSGGGAGS